MATGEPSKDPQKDNDVDWGKVAGVGFEIAVGVGLGALVGTFVDRRFHTKPWGLLVCVMLGVAAGMYLLIKEAIRANRD
jgi:F0F1-type ATP synthase assembly protein I